MLNLYLAPRGFRAPEPSDEAVDRLMGLLAEDEVVGPFADDGYPPAGSAARLFHADAHEVLLPAELTFDAIRVRRVSRPRFLPERPGEGFPAARCGTCGDTLARPELDEALGLLSFTAAERFRIRCPGCRTELDLRGIDFGQPVALARFWLFIEGAGISRLNPNLLERMGRALGLALAVVPEVPEDRVDDWVPARRSRRR